YGLYHAALKPVAHFPESDSSDCSAPCASTLVRQQKAKSTDWRTVIEASVRSCVVNSIRRLLTRVCHVQSRNRRQNNHHAAELHPAKGLSEYHHAEQRCRKRLDQPGYSGGAGLRVSQADNIDYKRETGTEHTQRQQCRQIHAGQQRRRRI